MLAAAVALALVPAAARASTPVAAENALPGDSSWRLEGRQPQTAIEGYARATSVGPGQTIAFAVSTEPGARYRIAISRLGWYGGAGGRLHACLPDPGCTGDEAGAQQPQAPRPDASGEVDAGWATTDKLQVPSDWVSGYYVANLIVTAGAHAGESAWVPFVVREPARASQLLVQVPVNTWQAYNRWGGKSLYHGDDGKPAVKVSFNRPYTYRVLVAAQEASFNHYELPLVRFLERQGYDASYATDVDVDRHPSELLRHRLVMTAGHGEYWTKRMRDGFDAARDESTNLAFMGANTAYWQMRYEDHRRTIVEYRSGALDPVRDPARQTVRFRNLEPARPECMLLGVQHQLATSRLGDRRGYKLTDKGARDPWNRGTGLARGVVVPYLVGYEWDTTLPWCRPPHLRVLLHWVRGAHSQEPSDAEAVRYTADSGARVFSTGAMQFSWGLYDPGEHQHTADPRIQRFTENALDDLTRPAPPTSVRVNQTASGFEIGLDRHADPRFRVFEVFEHPGSGSFGAGDPGAHRVCRTTHSSCTVPRSAGAQRFAAAVVDVFARRSRLRRSGVVGG